MKIFGSVQEIHYLFTTKLQNLIDMAKFKYYQDQLVKVWERRNFTIDAETQEEADKIAKEIAKSNYQVYAEERDDVEFTEQETLFDTEENVSIEENDRRATMEVWRGTDLIATNQNYGED